MKTIATMIAIISLMITIPTFAGNGNANSNAVNYKVTVHIPGDRPFYTRNVFVVMTDENNHMIAPAQLLRYGIWTYGFNEGTSVTGTRIAKLVFSDGTTTTLFWAAPDSKTGKFTNGITYLFDLFIAAPDKGNNTKGE
ncbi:MAG: hypothetical protein NTU98_14755 [Bacteroidetes bacterium]|nr:hypothetical protein [Bacteroidota bacterium]